MCIPVLLERDIGRDGAPELGREAGLAQRAPAPPCAQPPLAGVRTSKERCGGVLITSPRPPDATPLVLRRWRRAPCGSRPDNRPHRPCPWPVAPWPALCWPWPSSRPPSRPAASALHLRPVSVRRNPGDAAARTDI